MVFASIKIEFKCEAKNMIKRVVIIGGGSAGWLTAAILAARFKPEVVNVVLVESSDIPTIGVGEGTWPTMRTTLESIGISEADFINCCSASFKQGSRFVGWRNGQPDDVYYHPFTAPLESSESNIYGAWKSQFPELSFDHACSVQGAVSEQNLAPKQLATPEYAGVLSYGYHLDAGKFSELLKAHCINKLGVHHVLGTVRSVDTGADGDISGVVTQCNQVIEGDLFVDCSGTGRLLLGKHFGIPFVSCADISVNDRALAVQAPYASDTSPIASTTVVTAQSAGWTWDIGLSSRRGVGYVYSSAHVSDGEAEQTLRHYVGQSLDDATVDDLSVRSIKIQPGYHKEFWHRNCVAVGMAAGFIEPLEASALVLVELSVNMIRDELPMTRAGMHIVAKRFNQTFQYRWKRIIEFLKLHYCISERRDTDYWCDVTAPSTVPTGLADLLKLWRYRSPHLYDLMHAEEMFPSASYQYVLYGMGFKSELWPGYETSAAVIRGMDNIRTTQKTLKKYLTGLPNNRALLSGIAKSGSQKT